jgi:hypothetical protein
MPRERLVESESEKGVIARFFEKAAGLIRKWVRAVVDWIGEWLRRLFSRSPVKAESGYSWMVFLEVLLYGLLAAVVVALALLGYHFWRNRRRPPAAVASEAIQSLPDLRDERLGADQLPEDGWTQLARELLERGELRLALRAFYLASLAHLAGRNLISIARFKSNRDYERELRRRAHALPELISLFDDNLSVVERVWYGLHEVGREAVEQFAAKVQRMRAGA